MADKTMPERIWACRDTVVDRWGGIVEEGWHTEPWFDGETKYIRADIAAGDPNEPFKDGQYRWVEIGGQWIAGKISGSNKHNLYFYDVDGNETPLTALGVIGPVIRPPAGTTN